MVVAGTSVMMPPTIKLAVQYPECHYHCSALVRWYEDGRGRGRGQAGEETAAEDDSGYLQAGAGGDNADHPLHGVRDTGAAAGVPQHAALHLREQAPEGGGAQEARCRQAGDCPLPPGLPHSILPIPPSVHAQPLPHSINTPLSHHSMPAPPSSFEVHVVLLYLVLYLVVFLV